MRFTLKNNLPNGFYEPIFKRYYRYLFGPIVISGNMNTKSVCFICGVFKNGYRYTMNLIFKDDTLKKIYFNVTKLESGTILNLMAEKEDLDDVLEYIYSNYILNKDLDLIEEELTNG